MGSLVDMPHGPRRPPQGRGGPDEVHRCAGHQRHERVQPSTQKLVQPHDHDARTCPPARSSRTASSHSSATPARRASRLMFIDSKMGIDYVQLRARRATRCSYGALHAGTDEERAAFGKQLVAIGEENCKVSSCTHHRLRRHLLHRGRRLRLHRHVVRLLRRGGLRRELHGRVLPERDPGPDERGRPTPSSCTACPPPAARKCARGDG